jgi:predicted outer membrane protein
LPEIQGGRAALAKSKNAAVDKLATTIVTDHTAMLASADKLAGRLLAT